ncbi:MAG: hypothetical protein WCK05_15835 [Planctomycetota bacterium]
MSEEVEPYGSILPREAFRRAVELLGASADSWDETQDQAEAALLAHDDALRALAEERREFGRILHSLTRVIVELRTRVADLEEAIAHAQEASYGIDSCTVGLDPVAWSLLAEVWGGGKDGA